jgi:hypothetical protein
VSSYDLSDCPDLTPYAGDYRPEHPATVQPAAIRDDLLFAIRDAVVNQPRTLQKEIGPSQIGSPCNRWLAYKLGDVPPVALKNTPWRAAVGTAVHEQFADWLHRYNAVHGFRYLSETRVWVGDLLPGRPVTGHMDAFDTWTGTVIDLKTGTRTALDEARSGVTKPVYETQVSLYGQGAVNAGLPVRNVGILTVPRDGELSDAVWRVQPHDPERGRRGLARAGAIAQLVDTLGGPQAAAMQPASEYYCASCDWFQPGSTDLTIGCPGAPSFIAAREAKATTPPANLLDLAGPHAVTTPAQTATAPATRRDAGTPPAALLALAGTQTPPAPVPGAHR